MKSIRQLFSAALLSSAIFSGPTFAADYVIDHEGAHASINFKVQHLGYSWLIGRFNTFGGEFSYDSNNAAASNIRVEIDTDSVDSNHAERDKHLRNHEFLDVKKYPKANFVSSKIEDLGNGKLLVAGDFTFHGVTKSIVIDAEKIGEGNDPWGGYRAGFSGTTSIALEDFGIKNILGPASANVLLELHVEGVRK